MFKLELVETKKQVKQFVNFPLELYKDCPYYVPQFYADEMKAMNPENCDTPKYYMEAYLVKDEQGKVCGRVAAVLHKQYNALYNAKTVRFSRIEFINNLEVCKMLMNAVEEFARRFKMHKIMGPMGFVDQDREGLLIEGFDSLSTFSLNFNYDYYYKLLQDCGYQVDVTWNENQVYLKDIDTSRFEKMSRVILKRYHLHLAGGGSTRSIINKYKYKFFDFINETYGHLYGYVPVTHEDVDRLVKSFSIALNKDYFCFVLNDNDEIVAAGLSMPSISQAVHDTKGKMNPVALVKLLHAIKHPKILELLLIGVKDEYKHSGLPFIVINNVLLTAIKKNITVAETNAQLTTNTEITKLFSHLNQHHMRTRVALYKEV